jgi:hypothetical protein
MNSTLKRRNKNPFKEKRQMTHIIARFNQIWGFKSLRMVEMKDELFRHRESKKKLRILCSDCTCKNIIITQTQTACQRLPLSENEA